MPTAKERANGLLTEMFRRGYRSGLYDEQLEDATRIVSDTIHAAESDALEAAAKFLEDEAVNHGASACTEQEDGNSVDSETFANWEFILKQSAAAIRALKPSR